MADILGQIVSHKRAEVARDKQRKPQIQLLSEVDAAAPPRDFYAALTWPLGCLRVIAEVKRASPSAGVIRKDFDPVAIAQTYQRYGAAAISCLTDKKYFQGSLAYLRAIRQAVQLPILRKDFMIDPYQIYEARAAGADAILLIAECLSKTQLEEIFQLTGKLKMTALVEIYEPQNLATVQAVISKNPQTKALLGINNRNLKLMKTDLRHTLDLLPQVHRVDTLVSESGIKGRDDVVRLQAAGVHRILVGEHLMRQPNVGDALRSLMEA